MKTPAELRDTIQRFEVMIANHRETIADLRARRGGLSDQKMVEIDERVEVNQRIIEALNRTLEVLQLDLTRREPK